MKTSFEATYSIYHVYYIEYVSSVIDLRELHSDMFQKYKVVF